MAIDNDQIMKLFFPHAHKRQEQIKRDNTKFVHYTQAETAISIIENNEFWMRKATCMNDFMEAQHGWHCLTNAFDGDESIGMKMLKLFDDVHANISKEILDLVNMHRDYLLTDVYISCFSEHKPSENITGRLSMWRAYGNGTGVALVLNNKPFIADSDALNAYTSPVAYLDDEGFNKSFSELTRNIIDNFNVIRSLDKAAIINYTFSMLRFIIHSTKHIGFGEEKEWRVIYCPQIDRSSKLKKDICSIGGIPQPIYKIPLENYPEENFTGATIPELIDRIIIGPTEYPSAVREAFIHKLKEREVSDAEKKVFVSNIPLRC